MNRLRRILSEDGSQVRTLTLDVDEFLRRCLLHVLPKCFVRIRYFGLLAARCRTHNFAKAAHNRLWLPIANAMGHEISTSGKPKLCEGGPLDLQAAT